MSQRERAAMSWAKASAALAAKAKKLGVDIYADSSCTGPAGSAKYRRLQVGDLINEDTEFEAAPGHWRRLGDEMAISAQWMIGSKYKLSFFVPARQPIFPNGDSATA